MKEGAIGKEQVHYILNIRSTSSLWTDSGPQSNELSRGPPELVQHFRLYRGSSHRCKNAAYPTFDKVLLYR